MWFDITTIQNNAWIIFFSIFLCGHMEQKIHQRKTSISMTIVEGHPKC